MFAVWGRDVSNRRISLLLVLVFVEVGLIIGWGQSTFE
jgi:hypothetical protein